MAAEIHPTAIVNPKAELADSVKVGAYAIIEGDVTIDDGTVVHHHAFIGSGARIGKRCQVHHAAVVSNIPQDLKFKGERTFLEVGDDTVIREFAALHRGTKHELSTNAGTHDGYTRIGKGCLIMAYCHVAHDTIIGDGVILSNSVQPAGHVTIEEFAIVGGGCLVHQFCRIGTMSMIGGGAVVRKDIPPYSLVGGADARFSSINRIGLQRRGKTMETIAAVKNAYALIYYSGLNVTEGVKRVTELDSASIPEVARVIEFVRSSERGIVGAGK
jgi:UDP-N-acetylglucosamine acyltransferase